MKSIFPPSILSLLLLFIAADARQAPQILKERAILIEKHANAPVEFDDISLSGKSLKGRLKTMKKNSRAELQEMKINAADNWIKDIHISIRNVSDKPITAVSLEWWITHPALDMPLVVKMSRNLRATGRPMAMNEMTLIESRENGYQWATAKIKDKDSAGSITTATLKIGQVAFEDGTRWARGALYRQNPADPKHWIKIKTTEPGKINQMRKARKPMDKTIGPLVTSFAPMSKPLQGKCSPEGDFVENNCGPFCYDSCGFYAECYATGDMEDYGLGDYTPYYVIQLFDSEFCFGGTQCSWCNLTVNRLAYDFNCDIYPGDLKSIK
jgi:hypothetical protein